MNSGVKTLGASRRDRIIQATDVDALASKYSSVSKGYIHDPYINMLVEGLRNDKRNKESFTPKLPLINRGTYIRQYSVDRLVKEFLRHGGKQVISLGSGSDTRPFHLLTDPELNNKGEIIIHEIDFPVSTKRKVTTIKANKELFDIINLDEECESEIHTPNYHLHAKDLREFSETSPLLPGMDSTLPTLVLSECCLCYLEPGESDRVVHWFKHNFQGSGLAMVLYEPLGGNDQFGVVMMQNLSMRGISLPTLHKYPTLEAQIERLQAWGFDGFSRSADIQFIHENWLEEQDKARIDQLEFLDEIEELNLLLRHYCVTWAVTDNMPCKDSWDLQFPSNGKV